MLKAQAFTARPMHFEASSVASTVEGMGFSGFKAFGAWELGLEGKGLRD